jgi:hypothetical protein
MTLVDPLTSHPASKMVQIKVHTQQGLLRVATVSRPGEMPSHSELASYHVVNSNTPYKSQTLIPKRKIRNSEQANNHVIKLHFALFLELTSYLLVSPFSHNLNRTLRPALKKSQSQSELCWSPM